MNDSASGTSLSRHPFKPFTPADAVLVLIVTAVAVAFIPLMSKLTPATVVVYKENSKIAEYPLTENRIFSVAGAEGPVVIEVADRAIRVYRAACPNQICVHTGFVRRAGSQIVCVPNKIVVEVKALQDKSESIDGVVK